MISKYVGSRVYLIYFIIFVASFAVLGSVPLKTEYVYMRVAEAHNTTKKGQSCVGNASSSLDQEVAAEVSKWGLYLDVIVYLPACVAGMVITSWGDKVGRKVTLAIPQVGAVLGGIILCLVIKLNLSLNFLYVSSFVSGLGGYYMTLLMQGYAYVSDVTTIENRGKSYVILETSLGVGGGIGGFVAGYWVNAEGFFQPVVCTVALNFVCLLLIFVLPDTSIIREENKRRNKENNNITSHSNPSVNGDEEVYEERYCKTDEYSNLCENDVKKASYGSTSSSEVESYDESVFEAKHNYTALDLLRAAWGVYSSEYSYCEKCHGSGTVGKEKRRIPEEKCPHGGGRYPGRVWKMWVYLVSYDIFMFVVVGVASFQTIFFLSKPLCFSPILIGVQMCLRLTLVGTAPLVVLVYQKVFHFSNHTIIIIGLVGLVFYTAITGFAAKPYLVFIGTSMIILSNPAKPFIQVQMSAMVSEEEQGAVFSLLSFSETVSFLLATVSFLNLYPATIHIYPGFAWLVASGLSLIPIILIVVIVVADRRNLQNEEVNEPLIT